MGTQDHERRERRTGWVILPEEIDCSWLSSKEKLKGLDDLEEEILDGLKKTRDTKDAAEDRWKQRIKFSTGV